MRRTGLLLAAVAPVLAQSAVAATQAPAIPEWTATVWLSRDDGQLAAPGPQAFGGHEREWGSWIRPEDMPEDLRRRRLDTNTLVAIEVDASGRATGCRVARASTEPRLDGLVCSLLMARGRFAAQRRAPGETVAATWGMLVRWSVLDRAQVEARDRAAVPPAPPVPRMETDGIAADRRWPRLEWYGILRPVALPDLQAAWPRRSGRPAEGTTSLDLIVDPAAGITGCEVGVSSGNARLDAQACALARTMRFTYARPCDLWCREERLPLQFVWARRGSHVRTPFLSAYSHEPEPIRDPADKRDLHRYQPFRRALPGGASNEAPLADRSHSNRYIAMRYTIDPDGVVRDCQAVESSGSVALDEWFCRRMRGIVRFESRTDVFGTPVSEQHVWRFDLDQAR